jgi:hypothetical protein
MKSEGSLLCLQEPASGTYPISLRFALILLCLPPSGLFPSGSLTKILTYISHLPHALNKPRIEQSFRVTGQGICGQEVAGHLLPVRSWILAAPTCPAEPCAWACKRHTAHCHGIRTGDGWMLSTPPNYGFSTLLMELLNWWIISEYILAL